MQCDSSDVTPIINLRHLCTSPVWPSQPPLPLLPLAPPTRLLRHPFRSRHPPSARRSVAPMYHAIFTTLCSCVTSHDWRHDCVDLWQHYLQGRPRKHNMTNCDVSILQRQRYFNLKQLTLIYSNKKNKPKLVWGGTQLVKINHVKLSPVKLAIRKHSKLATSIIELFS